MSNLTFVWVSIRARRGAVKTTTATAVGLFGPTNCQTALEGTRCSYQPSPCRKVRNAASKRWWAQPNGRNPTDIPAQACNGGSMLRLILAALRWSAVLAITVATLFIVALTVVTITSHPAATSAGAQASLPDATSAPTSPADGDAIPSDVQAALASLSNGTVIVDCYPGMPRLPEGVVPSRAAGWSQLHPGFFQLPHGFCADNPAATPIPIRPDSADPPVTAP